MVKMDKSTNVLGLWRYVLWMQYLKSLFVEIYVNVHSRALPDTDLRI